MRGREKMLSNTGCPLPSLLEVEFDQAAIVQLGKLYCWGSAGCQFIVRLCDGREVFVNASKQSKEDERFLRRLAKPIRGWAPSRGEGFRTVWAAPLAEEPPDTEDTESSCLSEEEAAFESEVFHAMDEFALDYSQARFAVAEKAVVTALVDFGAWCRAKARRSTMGI